MGFETADDADIADVEMVTFDPWVGRAGFSALRVMWGHL